MKNTRRGFTGLVTVLIILIIGEIILIGLISYGKFFSQTEPGSTTKSGSKPVVTRHDELQIVIDDIKTNLPEIDKTLSLDEDEAYPRAVAYSVADTPYMVYADPTASLNFVGNDDASENSIDSAAVAIGSKLKRNSFVFVEEPPITVKLPSHFTGAVYYNGPGTGYYERDDSVCLLGSDFWSPVKPEDKQQSFIELDCVAKTTLADVAIAVKPFADVYSLTDDPDDIMGFGEPRVTTLESGYKYSKVGVMFRDDSVPPRWFDGGTGYFYTDATGSVWHYFTASQQGIICADLKPIPDADHALGGICVEDF